MDKRKRSPLELSGMKAAGEKISMVTCYDHAFARIIDETGIDIVLVGDSAGMVCGGHPSTIPVTMDEMIYHTRSVRRGTVKIVVADMPFMSYQTSTRDALLNAGRLLKEAGADAVKLEGGREYADTIALLTAASIPVMGHLGLMPQSVLATGGYAVQGKDTAAATRMKEDALLLEQSGAFSLVLEMVPEELAAEIAASLSIPVIGIGAGRGVDGQVLVIYDLLGMDTAYNPRYLKKYADAHAMIHAAVESYSTEVKSGAFPEERNVFSRKPV